MSTPAETRPFITLPADQPDYETLVDLTLAQRTELPGRFHTPVWLDATPGAFVCTVCWDDGEVTGWPCKPAITAGRHLFGDPRDAAPVSSSEDTPAHVHTSACEHQRVSTELEGVDECRACGPHLGGYCPDRCPEAEAAAIAVTPARVWQEGDKAVWRDRIVTIAGVFTDKQQVNLYDLDEVVYGRDMSELSEVPARLRWHVNQRVEIHNAITDKWSPATLTVVGSVTVPFEAVLDDGPACRFYNASPFHLRPLAEVPAGGEPA